MNLPIAIEPIDCRGCPCILRRKQLGPPFRPDWTSGHGYQIERDLHCAAVTGRTNSASAWFTYRWLRRWGSTAILASASSGRTGFYAKHQSDDGYRFPGEWNASVGVDDDRKWLFVSDFGAVERFAPGSNGEPSQL